MSTSTADIQVKNVAITEDSLTVCLADGRIITVPLEWFPRLAHATEVERKKWRLIAKGEGSIGLTWMKT